MIRITALLLSLAVCASAAVEVPPFFEQMSAGPQAAWRGWGKAAGVRILPGGFEVRSQRLRKRFLWDAAMGLVRTAPDKTIPGRSYLLRGQDSDEMLHAESVRAWSRHDRVSVRYYFGRRGLEFDIEIERGAPLPPPVLESVDGTFSVDSNGNVAVDGEPLLLRPVAYTVDAAGRREMVAVGYRRITPRRLAIEVEAYDTAARLVIDPVITYATYLAGSEQDSFVALREQPDGSVLVAGWTRSPDLPQASTIQGLSSDNPPRIEIQNDRPRVRCFVAKLSPPGNRFDFVSYINGYSDHICLAMDVDSSGRALLAGVTRDSGESTFATPNAQYPFPAGQTDLFLARVSRDGRSLEYATYLHLAPYYQDMTVLLTAGDGDQSYLAFPNLSFLTLPSIPGGFQAVATREDLVLLRYDISQRRFDAMTFIPVVSRYDTLLPFVGMVRSPTGAVYLFGSTSSASLPLRNQVQTEKPDAGYEAGFITAYSPDLRTQVIGTYIGGGQFYTQIGSLAFGPDGTVRVAGSATVGAIPGLMPASPPEPLPGGRTPNSGPFALEIVPGKNGFRRSFQEYWPRAPYLDSIGSAIHLNDGRACFRGRTQAMNVPAGGAPFSASTLAVILCVNRDYKELVPVTPVGDANSPLVIIPSRRGIWSVQGIYPNVFTGREIPYDLVAGAAQPSHVVSASQVDIGDLLLRLISFETPPPVLSAPRPVNLLTLSGTEHESIDVSGSNFANGMYLDIEGTQLPLTVKSSTLATLLYRASQNLKAGEFAGRLVIPVQPEASTSEPFPVVVRNRPPTGAPFKSTSNPRIFAVLQPVYDTSQVLWRGQPIPLRKTDTGVFGVEIPDELAGPGSGEFVLSNPRPGGGVRRQTVWIGTPGSTSLGQLPVSLGLAAAYQIDVSRKIVYALNYRSTTHYELVSYQLPAGDRLASVRWPRPAESYVRDLELSSDGQYLYFHDSQLRVQRFQTKELVSDLSFVLPNDAFPTMTTALMSRVRSLAGEPETIVAVTPAGRMVIYDRDRPRLYTTTEFPSRVIEKMNPIFATSEFVYAVERSDVSRYYPPCIVRYPVDSLGFGPAEDLCSLGREWGKYPEMKTWLGTLVLEAGGRSQGLRVGPSDYGEFLVLASFDAARNIGATNSLVWSSSTTQKFALQLWRLDSGEPIGHYPRQCCNELGALFAFDPIESVRFLDDGSLIVIERSWSTGAKLYTATVVADWETAIERYP